MIRSARDEDFDSIATITNFYIETTSIHFGYEPVSADSLRSACREGARYPWLVLEEGGEVIGYAKAGVWRSREAYQWTTEVGLYVAEGRRGGGLGTTLYAALLDELARGGFRSAIAGITLPNDPSIALHRRFGFVSVGTVREAGYKHGHWHDVELWQRRLAP